MSILLELLPLLVAVLIVFFSLIFWPHRIKWWEVALPPLAAALVLFGAKWSVELLISRDTEWLTGFAQQVEYHEMWDEEVSCQHPIYVSIPSGTDANGNTTYTSVYMGDEHDYDVRTHQPYYLAIDPVNGFEAKITSQLWERIRQEWGAEKIDLVHQNVHNIDGDMWVAEFDGKDEHMLVLSVASIYENRLQSSKEFVFDAISRDDKTKFALVDYPRSSQTTVADHHSLFGGEDENAALLGERITGAERADWLLSVWNARHGRELQIRMLLLLYRNQPEEAAEKQRNYWKGGNKNEVVICVGVNDADQLLWCDVFSWMEGKAGEKLMESIEAEFEAFRVAQAEPNAEANPVDLSAALESVFPLIEDDWVRREFTPINSVVSIVTPWWGFALQWCLAIGGAFLAVWWAVANQHRTDEFETNAASKYRRF